MSGAPIDAGTKDWFTKKFGVLDETALSKFLVLKKLFNLTNDDVYVKWESFVVTQEHGELDPSGENVDKFQTYLQEAIAAAQQKKTPAIKKVRDLASAKRKPRIDFSLSPGMQLPSTPQLKKHKPALTSEPDSSPTREHAILSSPRKPSAAHEANSVIESLNPHVEVTEYALAASVVAEHDPKKYRFRTMAMKLLESADVLDEQIDAVSAQLLHTLKGTEVQLSNPCMSSQFDVVCCGRIVPDSPFYDPLHAHALNDKSLYLETSRLGGIGQRVPLDVSALSEYSFFPGQVVALRGRNPTGRTFVVHEVVDLPQLGVPVSSLEEIRHAAPEPQHGTKVFVAAGPFSNQHSLNYDKLLALVTLLNTEIKPQVAVLFGPFLDLTNKAVESGDIEIEGVPASQQPKTLDELFRVKVTPILKQIDPEIKVVLLPSLKDAVSKHTSYPQTSFDRKKLGLPKNFRCFPNPSAFSVNEALFGSSNLDIFKDLKEVYKPSLAGDSKIAANRFDRVANHIFLQRRYYPMFPGSLRKAPISSHDAETLASTKDGLMAEGLADIAIGGSSLEVPYLGLAELGDSLPDVLLIPSEMKYFAKVVRGVIVINPGQFIRPSKDELKEDGSYAVVHIKPANDSDSDNIDKVDGSDLYYHNIYKRCRVDIYRS